MWRWLRDRRFSGCKFCRQHPLGDDYLDFFCEEAELNVELDGRQHGFPDQRQHDAERESFLQSHGIIFIAGFAAVCCWTSSAGRDINQKC